MARKCRYDRKELPPVKQSDRWKRAGYCDEWCMAQHGIAKAEQQRKRQQERERKRERAETRKARERIKTKPELTREAQKAFNAYIRARDHGKPCISCGRLPAQKGGGTMDCGHYRSTGACPELRFDERNAHAQCVYCNRHLSGNAVDYRLGLIDRIGLDQVEDLERNHPQPKWSHDDLRAIRDRCRKKTRQLRKHMK